MEESLSDNRLRFEIELKYGETTIVSWVQLLKHSGIIPLHHSPSCSSPEEEEPQKQLHEEDESRSSNCSNIILKKEKDEYTYRSPTIEHCRPKKQTAVPEATKNTKIGHARVRSVALTSNNSEQHSLDNRRFELPDLNMPYTMQAASTLPTHTKDESCSILNRSMLESTILELETMAADSRRLHGDVEDAVGTKSRLPRELKKKLETVARLAHSTLGRISDELIMHLTSILGHWLKPRTLKRWLRDMVPSEISACGGDAIRFSQIKSEVIEMIKLRNPSKDGLDKEFIESHGAPKAKYSMDHEMEDKICDFYDVYVQGMDEIKSSDIRKFYIQLAALWPTGTMDNHGVRNAICSSKERRRTALREKGHETGKRKTVAILEFDEDLHGKAKLVAAMVNDTNAPVSTFPDTAVPGTPELNQNLSAPAKRFSPPSPGSCQ
ncbi:hypothetical protein HanRHA438_Chr15g0690041 [Helianthus annuus]|uniref:Uncharacterized protein n=1 Tax=Helianthus annuus TaxID=4232 RepID=A0A251S6E8_HELAN|nr:ubinuclein-2 isoform X1 [Helianthus annuus]KAF5763207.1 hypothetical protein HanXRQr2_Chr15g0677581 [Helianthus annuus]KAJ0454092.1 hypothetical protein HanIR_Chr15g0736311 [Helianthus annuus]KAJ0651377.1 hypothetical protein HanOQP8_Chr15g0560321 [Helianthus annuus]KAJ0829951.1 hypothetical protein HanPSC8_Chr15g0649621 [Helianthus annuus]KAJ0843317.1 hypothetical protein HanRHA438_Chr15g0690041 [Helianthus annuus]